MITAKEAHLITRDQKVINPILTNWESVIAQAANQGRFSCTLCIEKTVDEIIRKELDRILIKQGFEGKVPDINDTSDIVKNELGTYQTFEISWR